MTSPARFADIHIIQAVPFANLNRDELGAPKELSFGGATRMRASSQCYKRATRTALQQMTDGDEWDFGTRSRAHAETIAKALQERGWQEMAAKIAARDLFSMLDDDEADGDEASDEGAEGNGRARARKAPSEQEQESSRLLTNVLLYLNDSDIPRLVELAEAHRDDYERAAEGLSADAPLPVVHKKNDTKWHKELLGVLKQCTGAGLALFGRMIAKLPEGRIDGASQVAHAFTTHEAKFEIDYFTAVDDLLTGKESSGSGHLGTAEYASGVFYRYATLDLRELHDHFGQGSEDTAAHLAGLFLQAFAMAVPSGKKTSTAPHTPPALVYTSLRSDRPVNLAAAFETPVRPARDEGHLPRSLQALATHLTQLESFFGGQGRVWHGHAATVDTSPTNHADDETPLPLGERMPLSKLRDAMVTRLSSGDQQ
ncbi:type I-E CRISPR-associated protein Cas7/Cse4/CasC [Nocardiopsis rhodophaea]|uniref:Type I-E CRISPR-associated protein Cas7/Cse4/CasC n=1 Tax=Nocardiopsis rhodophaea TaxID=280238 RepID=A0ABN2SNF5_9ACTN